MNDNNNNDINHDDNNAVNSCMCARGARPLIKVVKTVVKIVIEISSKKIL